MDYELILRAILITAYFITGVSSLLIRSKLSGSLVAKTPFQARQLITHGHIAIGDRKVYSPGYIVKREEEELISYAPTSPFINKKPPGLEGPGGEER